MINFDLVKYAKYTEVNGAPTYASGRSMGESIAADLTLEYAEGSLYTGLGLSESIKEILGGALSIGVKELDYQARADLYGHTRTQGTESVPESVRVNVNDQANAVGIGLVAAVMRSGVRKYRAVFFDKVKFGEPAMSFKVKEKTITFSTPTTSGAIMPNPNGDMIDDAVLDTLTAAEAWIDAHLAIQVATPVANPAAGAVADNTEVALTCATVGATIRYTLDGSEPTEMSLGYVNEIVITDAVTIKAKAFKTGMTASAVLTAAYTISV